MNIEIETREQRLATENHALRAKLVDAERELDRRDRVIAKQALRIDALENALGGRGSNGGG